MTYHINPDTGVHGKCTATVKDCPYQKQGIEQGITTHFSNAEEARSAGEKIIAEEYEQFEVMKKNNQDQMEKVQKQMETMIAQSQAEMLEMEKKIQQAKTSQEQYEAERAFTDKILDNFNSMFNFTEEETPKEKQQADEIDKILNQNKELTQEDFNKIMDNVNIPKSRPLLSSAPRGEAQYNKLFEKLNPEKMPDMVINYLQNNLKTPHQQLLLQQVLWHSPVKLTSQQLRQIAEIGMITNSKYTHEFTLQQVCRNENTEPEILKKLSTNRYRDVKIAIAQNPNTPAEVLIKYSKMKNGLLLWDMAGNQNLPVEAQINIAKYSNAQAAKYKKDKPVDRTPHTEIVPGVGAVVYQAPEETDFTAELLLRNPKIDTQTLDELANSPLDKIVRLVKQHPKTSMKTILRIQEEHPDL